MTHSTRGGISVLHCAAMKETIGFLAIASAALAYQWSSRARYFMVLPMGFLPGCIVVSQRALDELHAEQQHAVRTAAAKFEALFDETSRAQEQALLGGLFQKQGIAEVPVSPSVKAELFDVAHRAREQVGGRVVRAEVLQRVLGLLADFRASR